MDCIKEMLQLQHVMKGVFRNHDRIFLSGHPRIKVSLGEQQMLPNSFRRRSRTRAIESQGGELNCLKDKIFLSHFQKFFNQQDLVLTIAGPQTHDPPGGARLTQGLRCILCVEKERVVNAENLSNAWHNVLVDPIVVDRPKLNQAVWISILRNLGSNTVLVIALLGFRHSQRIPRTGCPRNACSVRRS